MKKLLLAMIVAAVLSASPAFALFVNGGFETGNFDGWTLEQANVNTSTIYSAISWTAGTNSLSAVIGNGSMQPGQTLPVNVYNETKMARINDIGGSYHATQISQSDNLVAEDLGKTIYVNWGAMLVDPSHPIHEQPNFGINIFKGTTSIYSFTANATTAGTAGSGWTVAGHDTVYGDPLYYKSGTWSQALDSTWGIGDAITIKMWVTDCGQSGHGGFAFLDGIGTTYQPPNTVPEPATMVLFGIGLLGLAGVSRKKR